jgi:hypothetical protein
MNMSRSDAIFSAHYGRRFCHVESRLWGRIALLFSMIEMLAGTIAFGAWMSDKPTWLSTAGLVVAITAAMNQLIAPRERALRNDFMREKFGAIILAAPTLPDAELAARVTALQNEPAPELEALRDPVYIQTAQELGWPHDPISLSVWQRFVSALA